MMMNNTGRCLAAFLMVCTFSAYAAPEYSTVALDDALGMAGSIAFKIETDKTYHTGPDAKTIGIDILEIPGIAKFSFAQSSTVCELQWMWARGVRADNLMVEVPELSGPGEYFIQYTWDAEAGIFTGYVNGTALRLPEMKLSPWEVPAAREVRVMEGSFETELMATEGRYQDAEHIREQVPESLLGKGAILFGASEIGVVPVDVGSRLGNLLYETSMDTESSLDGWVMEGPGGRTFGDGWMNLFSNDPDSILKRGHIVYWCPQEFPDSFVAEWEIQITAKEGLCIVFFAAKGSAGKDIFDESLPERTGIFKQYTRGAIDCYHISYYANTPSGIGRITSNIRKNSGFYLVSNGPPGIEPGSDAVHAMRLVKDGAYVQLQVDGQVIVDFTDDGESYGPVLECGKIGLRQMQWTKARYRNFRVYELMEDK